MKKAIVLATGGDSGIGEVAKQALRDADYELVNIGNSCGTGDPILMAKSLIHTGNLAEPQDFTNKEPWYVQHDQKKRRKKK